MKKLVILAVLVMATALYAQAPVRFNTQTLYWDVDLTKWTVADQRDTINLTTTHQTVWLPAIDLWNGYASLDANYIIGSNDSIQVFCALSNYPAALTPCGADTVEYKLNKVDSIMVTAAKKRIDPFKLSGKFGKSIVFWIYNEGGTATALSRVAASVQ